VVAHDVISWGYDISIGCCRVQSIQTLLLMEKAVVVAWVFFFPLRYDSLSFFSFCFSLLFLNFGCVCAAHAGIS
jgi:hypothetical protein